MCLWIYCIYHIRSIWSMSSWKKENNQWWRYSLGHWSSWVWWLQWTFENISPGSYHMIYICMFSSFISGHISVNVLIFLFWILSMTGSIIWLHLSKVNCRNYTWYIYFYIQKYRQAAKGDKPDNSQSSSSSSSSAAAANAAAADTSNFNTNNWANNMQPVQVQSINSSVPSSINNTTRSVPQQSSMQMPNATMNGNFVPATSAQLAAQVHVQRMIDEQQQK